MYYWTVYFYMGWSTELRSLLALKLLCVSRLRSVVSCTDCCPCRGIWSVRTGRRGTMIKRSSWGRTPHLHPCLPLLCGGQRTSRLSQWIREHTLHHRPIPPENSLRLANSRVSHRRRFSYRGNTSHCGTNNRASSINMYLCKIKVNFICSFS